ncbi:hypothetical protein GOP47_0002387 [Adiantum capillus-veneris]|uniref:Pentatricopeptide repeat-containing protein n=1 Tax=Adiantum capillus-veneris TaxID=13818 RepID=A0A9D4ZP56_ADICA|nr:hypothetical protein GOP47_0002387 [Adiantum capillus-veneris]
MPPQYSVDGFSYILQTCRFNRDSGCALPLLTYTFEYGLQTHTILGSTLFSTVAELGCIQKVLLVCDPLVHPHQILWCSLVQELVQQDHPHHALNCFREMQEKDDSFQPCAHTLVALLKACAKLKDLDAGMHIHQHVATFGLDDRNVFLGTALVDMYAKCGCLSKAREVFNKMSSCNVVTWTALIAGCIEQGDNNEALFYFEKMRHGGIIPDAGMFVCALKGCGGTGELRKGHNLCDEIIKRGLDSDIFVGNTLVDMYVRCGLLTDAQAVFDALLNRDLISWNALLSGYAQNGLHELALNGFEKMRADGISPNEITFVCVLKACGGLGARDNCREKHNEAVQMGFMDLELFIVSILIDVYSKCDSLAEAQKVLSSSRARDVVSWNAMIGGYIEHDFHEEALSCLEQMEIECISPDVCTYVYALKACGCVRKTLMDGILHADIVKRGLERDPMIGRPLIDMYAHLGSIEVAQNVFDSIPVRNVFIWDALIGGYMGVGDHKRVLSCSEQLEIEGIPVSYTTIICSMGSCARLGVAAGGRALHANLVKIGMEKELAAGYALADMYISCGLFMEVKAVFSRMSHRNVALWTALIAGYAQLGDSGKVFGLLNRMREDGHSPDLVTFLMVLNACSRAGLLDEGERYFMAISVEFFLVPTIEHFTCMVDLCGRSGDVIKAVFLLENMPYHPGLAMWNTMLWACRKWENVELAKSVFEEALQLNDRGIAAYISMSNIYSNCRNNDDAWSTV